MYSARRKSKACSARWRRRAVAARRRSSAAARCPVGPAPPRLREKVTPYDFKRPERVGKEQMRALQSLHEGFGRNFGAALSAMLRSIVEVKLTSVDQLTYSEFVFSLENPTCFNLLRAEPLEGNLILDINPSILYPIIDRMLGGGKEAGPRGAPAADGNRTAAGVADHDLFLEELKQAWENVLPLTLEVERVESNPQLVQIVPPNEVVVLISFELTIGEVRGMMNLCIPFNSIERISNRLTANNWVSYGRAEATKESMAQISRQIQNGAGRSRGDARRDEDLDEGSARPARRRHHHDGARRRRTNASVRRRHTKISREAWCLPRAQGDSGGGNDETVARHFAGVMGKVAPASRRWWSTHRRDAGATARSSAVSLPSRVSVRFGRD